MQPVDNNKRDDAVQTTWLSHTGEVVALVAALRTVSKVFAGRYPMNQGGLQAGAAEAILSWLLPSLIARGAISYIPSNVPHSELIKGLMGLLAAAGVSMKVSPFVSNLILQRFEWANWGSLGKAMALYLAYNSK